MNVVENLFIDIVRQLYEQAVCVEQLEVSVILQR